MKSGEMGSQANASSIGRMHSASAVTTTLMAASEFLLCSTG